jgi:hypothetical protein
MHKLPLDYPCAVYSVRLGTLQYTATRCGMPRVYRCFLGFCPEKPTRVFGPKIKGCEPVQSVVYPLQMCRKSLYSRQLRQSERRAKSANYPFTTLTRVACIFSFRRSV